jgi:hypothetical protein
MTQRDFPGNEKTGKESLGKVGVISCLQMWPQSSPASIYSLSLFLPLLPPFLPPNFCIPLITIYGVGKG